MESGRPCAGQVGQVGQVGQLHGYLVVVATSSPTKSVCQLPSAGRRERQDRTGMSTLGGADSLQSSSTSWAAETARP
ncbi:MAG: hypothetical protein JWN47_3272 [Frankiales bacterium]|nr:hypothetical protein [Frankiales bacterium]